MERIIVINDINKDISTRKATAGPELNLVNNFIDYKMECFSKTKNSDLKLAIFCEPQIDNAFPDIIFAEFNEMNFKSWNQHRKNITNQDLKILYHLYYSKGLASEDIVKQLGVSYATLLKSIERLIDCKFIARIDGLWCINSEENCFSVTKIETIEAKINQWEVALKQALNNVRFSSESYVLSELMTKPTANTMGKFANYGIGVYLKNPSGIKRIHKAKHSSIPNSYTSLLIGEVIGRTLNY